MKLEREKVVPYLKQGKKILLYYTEWNAYNIPDFVKKFGNAISGYEQKIIMKKLNLFRRDIPKFLIKPMASTEEIKIHALKSKKVYGIGSRSAYWPKRWLKLKGCRPKQNLLFPYKQLEFGSTKMITARIPFGVLSAENVMREILAFCFFKSRKIDMLQKPVCVFEYVSNGKIIGYCLILSSPTEHRLESEEDFYGLSIKDLIWICLLEKKFGIKVLPDESGFVGISKKWYSEQKSGLLIRMNFSGGFRGILNSNLGNDLAYKNRFYICDFDTFRVIEIPKKPTYDFIKKFCLWCIVELLKSSPLVMNYIDMKKLGKRDAATKLWKIYSEKSSLWKLYKRKFFAQARKFGWNLKEVEKAINEAAKTDVFYELILDNVLNSQVLKTTYKPELSFYMPHNY